MSEIKDTLAEALAQNPAVIVPPNPAVRRFMTPPPLELEVTDSARRFFAAATRTELEARGVSFPVWDFPAKDDAPSNKTVLLVHGWGASAGTLRTFVRPLQASGHRVVLFDGPAHGEASGTVSNLRVHTEAALAAADFAGEVHAVVGHSLGGLAACWAAREIAARSSALESIALVATPPDMQWVLDRFVQKTGASDDDAAAISEWMHTATGRTPAEIGISFLDGLALNLLSAFDDDDEEAGGERTALALADRGHKERLVVQRAPGAGHALILADRGVIRKIASFV